MAGTKSTDPTYAGNLGVAPFGENELQDSRIYVLRPFIVRGRLSRTIYNGRIEAIEDLVAQFAVGENAGFELQYPRIERRIDGPHSVAIQPAHDIFSALRMAEFESHDRPPLADADEEIGMVFLYFAQA
jgi:hypothetical protein